MNVPVFVHILTYLLPSSVRQVLGYVLESFSKYNGEDIVEYAMKCVEEIPRADEEIEEVVEMIEDSTAFIRNALCYDTFSKVVKKGRSRVSNFLIDTMNCFNESVSEDYDSLLKIPYYKKAENIYKIAMYIVSSFEAYDPTCD